jgi:S-adenosylmethionine:tRNA ribosyltransferase-isomerase
MLLVRRLSGDTWSILMKERYTGTLIISETLIARVSLGKTARFEATGDVADLVWRHGKMPLPPYIKRTADETDMARYQTVYAEVEGSIAAPTAGLHFTEGLLDVLREKSVRVRTVTLHVGTGTFRPIRAQAIADHVMDEERFAFDAGLIAEIDQTKNRGDRVVAVGTTTTRTLEGYASGQCSVFSANGTVHGSTGIFIREGYRFRIVDAMITNFHLPCSTPLVLSAAFAGREKLLGAYGKAISGGYRFFSYGDAMLLL